MRIYGDLAREWYPLLDPRPDHADEAELYASFFGDVATLLELGSGAGNAASFLKQRYAVTLCDRSAEMLELSRAVNPECEHVQGDMRDVRLDRTFDAVLIHDALSYLTERHDLRATLETAFAHLRPGGRAIFAPDGFRETFVESTDLHEGDDGTRSLRCLEWFWDPDPTNDAFVVEYVFVLRENGEVRVVHDRHAIGMFPRSVWVDRLNEVGFAVDTIERPLDGLEGPFTDEIFACVRPSG